MDYKKDFTDEFLDAMRNWDKPEGIKEEKFKKAEIEIKNALVVRKVIESYYLEHWDFGFILMCVYGNHIDKWVYFYELEKKKKTELYWINTNFIYRTDALFLRVINSKSLKLQTIFEKERDKLSRKTAGLW